MPPKIKIGRPSKAAQSPAVAVSPQASGNVLSSFDDAWTDEQETALFKSMIACKPVGLHKHFRMIHIYEYLRRHGHTSPEIEHTKIPGIWNKLRSLYNLEALDEREISFGDASLPDTDANRYSYYEFDVPDDASFEKIKNQRRLKPEGSKSPPLLSHRPSVDSAAANQRPSTVEDSEADPRSSPLPVRDTRSKRSGRGSRGNRKSQLHATSNNFPEKRQVRKTSVEDDLEDNESGEKEVEPLEEQEDDDKVEDTSSLKQVNTRSIRRRSGRRR